MYSLWSFVKLTGITFDIIGGSLIAIAVVREAGKKVSGETLPELEKDLDKTTNAEVIISSVGLGFIIFGFILLMIYEAYHMWQKDALRPVDTKSYYTYP